MNTSNLVKTAIFCLLGLPAVAHAHYVWIESETNAEARVYFGEFNEGVREKAGGRLDERAALEAWSERPDHSKLGLELVKRADHFSTRLEKATGWILAVDTKSEVKDYRKNDLGIVKPMFYARAAIANRPAAARPSLQLDLLPVPGDAKAVQVFFGGQPLAGAKVFVYAPNLWMQELQSDAQGKLTPVTPWPGRYVLDVVHKESKPGEFQGKRYDAVRHRMTLSFVR
ncbi:MAG: hypothetical protein ABI895_24575 [Deltaproteobacteria bacterium]